MYVLFFPELQVSFSQPSYTITEGDQLFSLEVLKSGATFSDIEVTILMQDITAEGTKLMCTHCI